LPLLCYLFRPPGYANWEISVTFTFPVGYGKGEIEPGIAPLVQAANDAGYVTFSSCEGHHNQDPDFPRFPLVSFYADEQRARTVHLALRDIRDQLRCSWILRASFVLHRTTNQWALGWTLENAGIIPGADTPVEFERLTVQVGREHDVPLLIAMFHGLANEDIPVP
jgi:hypothetical protein